MTDRLFTETLRAAVGDDLLARLSSDVLFADLGAETVRPLLTFEALSDLLATRPLEPPRLRLHRRGAPVPPARYTEAAGSSRSARAVVRPDALYRELRDGASLVLDAVDRLHPPIGAATDDLMRLVRERAQVNLYLIWGDSHGFDTHWDDHDTFIVQVAGTKSWQVHGPGSRRHPMKVDSDHGHTPPEGTVWEGVLRPGQVLHVPRGWWHTVTGTGDVSMHLTFGFTRATGIDWARSLLDRLHDVELLRRDLPRFATPDERRKHHHELVRQLVDLAERHDLDAFLAERDARFPRRQSFALPWAVDDAEPAPGTVVEFVPILAPPLERTEDGGVALTVSGRRYRLPAVAEPLLTELAAERTLTVGALAERSGTPLPTAVQVLRALVRHHLVLLRPGPAAP
ncbi:JmjC domain-containing protein [Marinitenerispora sediminis]|uniref:Cupin n=1 Tax=Marinitenerispora sediminis TaxID=1931232 RepID=A0A368T346_9ACTN|nr:cupin domain-containing protein [Marinitenerispora sediminis]RCV51276.1 cupin [Marinitenerispora sediminis]RCV52122.1 cupin [Marinitenerispora sediminis]RCV57825.1 cupin [Marinitenerispora sediminis]